jgi:TfoX/Sxy family transcriptional regulator of competence genes
MDFTPSSPELAALFDRAVPAGPDVSRRKMFGWPAAFVGGRMFASLHADSVVVRLGPADLAALLELPGSRPFEPMPGRPMTGYAVVPGGMLADEAELRAWLERALTLTRSLPPKK